MLNSRFFIIIPAILIAGQAMGQDCPVASDLHGVWTGTFVFGDNEKDTLILFEKDDNGDLFARFYSKKEDTDPDHVNNGSPFRDITFDCPHITWKIGTFPKGEDPSSSTNFMTFQGTFDDGVIFGPLVMPENFSPREIGSITITKRKPR